MTVGFREKDRVNMGRIECVVKGVGTDCIGSGAHSPYSLARS
jgi:hypothetical protein